MTRAEEDEALPFDVGIERLPTWVHAASGAVVGLSVLVAAQLAPMIAVVPFLLASSLGRRFASSPLRVVLEPDALRLGARVVPRSEVHDAWLDDDPATPRVAVAHGRDVELSVLHFDDREHARRFARALGGPSVVAGRRPRPIDLLASLRFAAIGAALVVGGSRLGLVVVALSAVGLIGFVRGRQIVAAEHGLEVRSAFGARAYAYAEIASVDVDAGAIRPETGGAVALGPGSVRDAMLASPAWLERARERVLAHIDARRRQARAR